MKKQKEEQPKINIDQVKRDKGRKHLREIHEYLRHEKIQQIMETSGMTNPEDSLNIGMLSTQ